MTSDAFPPAQILGGKYRVLRTLGEGGMAIVLEAEHIKLGHKVALKVLRAELAKEPSVVFRFEREGRALSKLRSPNVVRVVDVDATPSGLPFLVMELLEGGDLETELRRRGPLPIAEAVQYTLQACSALQEAHDLGIVHRDIKPTNLFLATEGRARVVKVLDFGIATDAPLEGDVRLTRTESVLGTPLYMAPEQFRSAKDVDARADVWALGATLYELVTGAAPFTGSATTIGVSIVSDEVRPIETLRADVPAPLRGVILRALEKDRERRFQTMAAFAEALRPFGEGVVIAHRSSAHSFHEVAQVGRADTLLEAGTPDPSAKRSEPDANEPRPATAAAVTRESAVTSPRASPAKWPIVAAALVGLVVAGTLALRGKGGAHVPATETSAVVALPPSAPPAPPASAEASPSAAPSAIADAPVVDASAPPPARKGGARPAPPPPGSPQTPRPAPSAAPHAAPDPSHPLFFPR